LGWLFSIAYSLYDELRGSRANERVKGARRDAYPKPVSDLDQCAHDLNPRYVQIVAAVQGLPEPQRLAMLIVMVEGLSYSEAANALNTSVDRVASLLSQARQSIGALFLARERA
jgi:RNA polymerase sigma-70 factor (ECF subfamily)